MLTGTEHDRIATPPTCTVQAPLWASPEPFWGRVGPTSPPNPHNGGVGGAPPPVWVCLLTGRRAIRIPPLNRHSSGDVRRGSPAGVPPPVLADELRAILIWKSWAGEAEFALSRELATASRLLKLNARRPVRPPRAELLGSHYRCDHAIRISW